MLMPWLLVLFMALCLTLRKIYTVLKEAVIRLCCKRKDKRTQTRKV